MFPAQVSRTAPRGTNQYPWTQPLPFDPTNPFNTTATGTINNTSATPAAATDYQRFVTTATLKANGANAAGELMPASNPTEMHDVSAFWISKLDEAADMVLVRPYLALYDQLPDPSAFDTDPIAAAVSATIQFWLVKRAGPPIVGKPLEFNSIYAGKITIANNGVAMNTSAQKIPAKAQGCAITIATSALASPGLMIEGAGGAEVLAFDQKGAEWLVAYVSNCTSNTGVGWELSHL